MTCQSQIQEILSLSERIQKSHLFHLQESFQTLPKIAKKDSYFDAFIDIISNAHKYPHVSEIIISLFGEDRADLFKNNFTKGIQIYLIASKNASFSFHLFLHFPYLNYYCDEGPLRWSWERLPFHNQHLLDSTNWKEFTFHFSALVYLINYCHERNFSIY
jgi:hypothetical protein